MRTKTVYQLDSNGIYLGEERSFESPLEPSVFLIPAGCIEVKPPEFSDKQYAKWNGKEYEILDIPEPEKEPAPPEPTKEELEAQEYEAKIQAEIRQMAIERIEVRERG
jgi:hypothetical protein